MLLKRIVCDVATASRDGFATAQAAWTALSGATGFVGQIGGWRADDPKEAVILGFWRERAAYEQFMQHVHDGIVDRSRQADTYTRSSMAIFDVAITIDGSAGALSDAIRDARFVRIAECSVRAESRDHFVQCQREIWNPAMRAAGILGGVFTERADNADDVLVCTFWPDQQMHAVYVASTLPTLRERARVAEDCTSVIGRSFIVEPAWVVRARNHDGA